MKLAFLKYLQITPVKIKWVLVGLAAFIIAVVLLYTQMLVEEIKKREQRSVELYSDCFTAVLNTEAGGGGDVMAFIQEQIVPTIYFPVIATDPEGEPLQPYENNTLNVEFSDENMSDAEKRAYLLSLIENSYPPYEIRDSQGEVLQIFYYSNSQLITRLQLFPFIQFFVIGGFILIGYVGFNFIRASEQSNVWVGMAKEAAHQLGTPISSLLAWLEIIKMEESVSELGREAINEMTTDVHRLSKIADRFSKIGSRPERVVENLTALIGKVTGYFANRLPKLGKRVRIKQSLQENVHIALNAELFEWVIENLIKNAAEAMESNKGEITISMEEQWDKVIILVQDNGKGMLPAVRRTAFKPGFTTKKRGWGLGLSLCKRIVEDYHKGKIYIKDSAPGRGTTFAIELKTDSSGTS